MASNINEDREERYLEILKNSSYYENLLDFKKLQNLIIQKSVKDINLRLNNLINQTLHDNASRILPILVFPEIDNSRLCFLLKNVEKRGRIIYIPPPPIDIGIFFHIYNSLIEELESELLEKINLKITSDIEDEAKSLEKINLILERTKEIFIFYFDEIHLPYKDYGKKAQRRFLESISKLRYYVKNLIIIIGCSKDFWKIIADIAGSSIYSSLEKELYLNPLGIKDLKEFVKNSMKIYWKKHNIEPPNNPYFPLKERLLEIFYHETNANSRDFSKLCIKFIEKIVMEKISLENFI